MRESFVFYRSFFEALKGFSDEQKGKCYSALANYALNGSTPDAGDPVVTLFFAMARAQVDANNQRYENGRRGGRPKNLEITETKPKNNQEQTKRQPDANQDITENPQTETKRQPNVNANENVLKEKDNLKVIQKEKRFTKPSVEEIKSYCEESGNNLNPQRFFDFYESKGWKVGNSPMKDWKAAVRGWCSRERTLEAAKGLLHKTGIKSGSYRENTPL